MSVRTHLARRRDRALRRAGAEALLAAGCAGIVALAGIARTGVAWPWLLAGCAWSAAAAAVALWRVPSRAALIEELDGGDGLVRTALAVAGGDASGSEALQRVVSQRAEARLAALPPVSWTPRLPRLSVALAVPALVLLGVELVSTSGPADLARGSSDRTETDLPGRVDAVLPHAAASLTTLLGKVVSAAGDPGVGSGLGGATASPADGAPPPPESPDAADAVGGAGAAASGSASQAPEGGGATPVEGAPAESEVLALAEPGPPGTSLGGYAGPRGPRIATDSSSAAPRQGGLSAPGARPTSSGESDAARPGQVHGDDRGELADHAERQGSASIEEGGISPEQGVTQRDAETKRPGQFGANDAAATDDRSVVPGAWLPPEVARTWIEGQLRTSSEGLLREVEEGNTGQRSTVDYQHMVVRYASVAEDAMVGELPSRRDFARRYFEALQEAE